MGEQPQQRVVERERPVVQERVIEHDSGTTIKDGDTTIHVK